MVMLTRDRASDCIEQIEAAPIRRVERQAAQQAEVLTALDLAERFRNFALPVPDFHRTWYDALRDKSRVLLNGPRDHAKTSVVLTHAEWQLISNRNTRIGIVSKTQDVAKAFLREMKRDFEGALLQGAGIRLKPERPELWNTDEIIVEGANLSGKDVSVFALGVGGQSTGRRADLLIFDDIETLETLKTDTARAGTREWFAKDMMPVLSPNGQAIVAYTRKHQDDLYGHLEADTETWTYVNNATQAILEDGSPLWPEHWSLSQLEAKKAELDAIDLTAWSSEYMNLIVPAGTRMFWPEQWPQWTSLPAHLQYFQAWDLAISEKTTADYTVGVCFGYDAETQDLYLADVKRGRWTFHEQQEEITAFGAAWSPLAVGIEAVQYQTAAVQEALRTTLLPVRPLLASGAARGNPGTAAGLQRIMDPNQAPLGNDKVSRARLLEARASAGKVHRPAASPKWWYDFAQELSFFPRSTKDDQVDAASYACRLIAQMAGGQGMRYGATPTLARAMR